MDLLATVAVYALASGALVDLWRNGSIFAGLRARAEALTGQLGELLGCDFCLTYQAALWAAVLVALPARTAPAPWGGAFELAALGLAAARGAWILNGLLPARLRYDRGLLPDYLQHGRGRGL